MSKKFSVSYDIPEKIFRMANVGRANISLSLVILVLRVVVGMSAEETAEAVGSTAGAVRVAQHRAIAKLKAEIGEAGRDYA